MDATLTGSIGTDCFNFAGGGFTATLGSHQGELTVTYDNAFGITLTADHSTFASYGTGTIVVNLNHPTVDTDQVWTFDFTAIDTLCPTELSTTYSAWDFYLDELAPW